ncbi:LysE family translocator [Pseudomonas xionganensis]|uniref:LysE family translocator n=1 Tax=Pseudomonas xionganensis TaxID=2654845 RepID=A0A6I4KZI6_9PSED|nr:LysE family transporter [Pseudomonas xionganensis]MVW76212.1 LysE family translocator [Pseudomonas xionganensis]
MALHTWLLYLIAVIGLSLTPGPNGLLALSHGAMHGHRKTLFTIAGGVLGFTLLMALSMLGIGTLLQASADILILLKWLGGAYLIWLGVQLWRAPALHLQLERPATSSHSTQLFSQGLLSALSNPKVILFFAAFLPQFIRPGNPLWLQFLIMAATFAVVEGMTEYLLARMAQRIRPWLQRSGKAFNRTCGGLFALMGAALPMTR